MPEEYSQKITRDVDFLSTMLHTAASVASLSIKLPSVGEKQS